MAILIAVAGILGDLMESMVKRETGVKDSGHLLPGLGGFWDVTDSVIPALLVTYLAVLVELIPSGALH